jgi:hypothetical protein
LAFSHFANNSGSSGVFLKLFEKYSQMILGENRERREIAFPEFRRSKVQILSP